MKRLGVNIDHVATVRNARDSFHPDPFTIAKHVMECGAHSITIHLREDRRHIKDSDVLKICKNKKIISQVQIDIPTYKENELPNFLIELPVTKPGSRDLK